MMHTLITLITELISEFLSLKIKNRMEDTPTSKIRSIAMGSVEVVGTVSGISENLVAPINQVPCAYYSFYIEKYGRGLFSKKDHWMLLRSGSRRSQFYLDDDTGRVLVDPEGAQIETFNQTTYRFNIFRWPSKNFRALCREHGIEYMGLLLPLRMRCTESTIIIGQELCVLGSAGDNPNCAEASAVEQCHDVMISKGDGDIYVIKDLPKKKVDPGCFSGCFSILVLVILGCLAVRGMFMYLSKGSGI